MINPLITRLSAELRDPQSARELAEIIEADLLTWTAPAGSTTDAEAIIALAFGYQLEGTRITPGPVNAQLAQLVRSQWDLNRTLPVFAQWEIANALAEQESSRSPADRIPPDSLQAIYPEPGLYLSTRGVFEQVKRSAKVPQPGRPVLILAHRDHVVRVVRLAQEAGWKAFTLPADELPADYDIQSAQPWTRNRRAYLLHDILSRLETRRSQITGGQSSPSRQLD